MYIWAVGMRYMLSCCVTVANSLFSDFSGCGESIVGEAPLPKGCGGGGGWKCKKWAMHILESPQIIEKCYTAFSAYYLRGCVEVYVLGCAHVV